MERLCTLHQAGGNNVLRLRASPGPGYLKRSASVVDTAHFLLFTALLFNHTRLLASFHYPSP
jgi:hypothetical protein